MSEELSSITINLNGDINRLIEFGRAGNRTESLRLLSSLRDQLARFAGERLDAKRRIVERVAALYGLDGPPVALPDRVQEVKEISVDDYVTAPLSGISVVTCCMNRSENLLKALPTWLQCSEIDEIVVVDWNSRVLFRDDLANAGISDTRIVIVRAIDQPRWILSYAFNLGFRMARYDKILKTDADIMISSTFFAENELREGTFLSGDWRKAENGQEHVNGFFFIRRADLMLVKGFNEYITTYGWDDDDLYFRLEQHGFNRVRIKTSGVYHIPHGDSQRLDHPSDGSTALDEFRRQPGCQIMGNRFIAAAMPAWGEDRHLLTFRLRKFSPNYLEAAQAGESWYQVPAHVRNDADYYGLVSVVSWSTDLGVYSVAKENLHKLLCLRRTKAEVSRIDVRLASCGIEPNWHRNVVVLQFDESVSGDMQIAVVERLSRAAIDARFTIFAESWLVERFGSAVGGAGLPAILPIPQGFHTQDLAEGSAEAVRNLPASFSNLPAFWVRLSPDAAAKVLAASTISTVPCEQDRIYAHVQHGLGNRLRALASATAIAQATGRQLVLIWTPDNHCECDIHDLFDYPGEVRPGTDGLDLSHADRYTYMELEPGACKDQPISLVPGRDLYIRSAYVINNVASTWDAENAVIQALRPSRDVMRLVDSVTSGSDWVGVHVRMEGAAGTDTNSYDAPHNWNADSHRELNHWRGQSHYAQFMTRIDQIIAERPDCRLYLATDTPSVYGEFRKRYGDRVAFLDRPVYDRSREQLIYALADAILLSRCGYLLGSTWSSFSELVQRLSTSIRRVEMSGVDF